MHCDIRLRVSVTCTFTIKHGTHVPVTLLHVVTYMTRIGYYALLTSLIAKACVVQWIECRPPDSGADGSNHGVDRYFFLFIEKFTEYFQTFIYILSKLSLCILCI